MKPREYMFVLIASLALVLAVAGFEYTGQVILHSEDKNAPSALYDLQEPYAKIDQLTQQLTQSIAKLDAILAQYATENERLTTENQAYKDYIDGFWRLMEQEYDFEGHQRMYERTH